MANDPASVSNLQARWQASAITSPPSDGGALATWNDIAGSYDLTQSTSGNRPVYRSAGAFLPNGKQVTEFARASSQWFTSSLVDSGATTRFWVVRMKTIGTNDQSIFAGDSGFDLKVDVNGKVCFDAINSAQVIYPDGAALSTGTWYVITLDTNGSNSTHSFINGTADVTSTVSYSTTSAATWVGARGGYTSNYCDMYLAEGLVYSRVLTAGERATVHSYIQEEYGITVSDYTASVTLQTLVPVSDVTTTGWTKVPSGAASFAATIDETTPDDADYAQSPLNPSSSVLEVALTASNDPNDNTNHALNYRLQSVTAASSSVVVGLYQGTTLIASWTETSVPSTPTDYSHTLTTTQAGNITDYSDLRIRVTATAS